MGVTARALEAAALVGATAAASAVMTTPAVAAMVMAAGATPADSVAAAAASASRVFLLRLPGGRPRLWGTSGVAIGSFTWFLLPSGRPRLRPPDPLGPPVSAPLRASVDDMVAKGMG
jgi:hypothetical protein